MKERWKCFRLRVHSLRASFDRGACDCSPTSSASTWPRQHSRFNFYLSPSMTSVKLYVYDLSQGMAKQMSLSLTGRQIGMYKVHVECYPFVLRLIR